MSAIPVSNLTLAYANALIKAGFPVFPCRQLDKRPATGNGLKDASTDPKLVSAWFNNDRGFNLAVRCGPAENGVNLLAVDVDPLKGGDETWASIINGHVLPEGPVHITRSGGQHIFFDAPEDLRNTRDHLGPGVDTRGVGGYVVAPPSKVVDPVTGEIGQYSASRTTSLVTVPVPMLPAWLMRLLLPEVGESVARHPSSPRSAGGVHPGSGPFDRVREGWDWFVELPRDGWTLVRQDGGDSFWSRPGKNPREGHSAVLHPGGAFVIYTEERPPGGGALRSGPGVTMSPGEYVLAYRCGGDWKAFGRMFPSAERVRAEGRAVPDPDPAAAGVAGEMDATSLNLGRGFWEARPVLAQIRQAAWAAGCSPDALLVQALARVATYVHPSFKLPGVEQGLIGKPQTLDFLGCVVAETSGGKTLAAGVAEQLVPAPEPPLDGSDPLIDFEQKVGSGEGIAEFFLVPEVREDEDGKLKATGKRIIGKQALFMSVDEGTGFTAQAGRKGTTIIATLASAWSGESLGQLNAAEQTRRLVRGGRVRICAVINMQDSNGWKLYSDELESVGFTGRLMFASAHDPSAPPPEAQPEWPGRLYWLVRGGSAIGATYFVYDPVIVDEIKTTRHGILTKQVQIDRRQSQYLLLRCKVAALLAVLDGRLDVTVDDWGLATEAIGMSSAVLSHLDAVHSKQIEQTSVTAATFKLDVAQSAEDLHLRRLAVGWRTSIVARLRKGPQAWKGLKDLVRADRRPALRAVLDEMVAEQILEFDGVRYKNVR